MSCLVGAIEGRRVGQGNFREETLHPSTENANLKNDIISHYWCHFIFTLMLYRPLFFKALF